MTTLNARHDYGLDLRLLSIDEGISGYRDDSLETVKRNQLQYKLPLTILSYRDLYGWSMDEIVGMIGRRGNCTFCGVFRRQALDRGAHAIGADKIVTGHNADDLAETVLLNVLRGDVPRLQRCTLATTGADGALPRSKPFKHAYEKEIVMYAHFKRLDYFSTECIYSPNAYRGFAREFLKDIERVDPRTVLNIIASGELVQAGAGFRMPTQGSCTRCGYISLLYLYLSRDSGCPPRAAARAAGTSRYIRTYIHRYISSQRLCKACVLLDDLARQKNKKAQAAIAYE